MSRLDNAGVEMNSTSASMQGPGLAGLGGGYGQPNPFNSTRLFQSSRMLHHHHPNHNHHHPHSAAAAVGGSKYDERSSSDYTPMEQRSKQHHFNGSLTGGGGGGGVGASSSLLGCSDMPSVLRSILKAENIDYRNDHYWLTKFHHGEWGGECVCVWGGWVA